MKIPMKKVMSPSKEKHLFLQCQHLLVGLLCPKTNLVIEIIIECFLISAIDQYLFEMNSNYQLSCLASRP